MEQDIGKIIKDDQTNIILRIDDFGGQRGLIIREFVTSDRYTGFTKAGIRIKASDFKKFKDMINFIDENMMLSLEIIEKKSVKDRTEGEHHFLIKEKYNGSVRDYFLSMGYFIEPKK